MQQTRPDTPQYNQLLELLSERMGLELIGTRKDAALAAIHGAMAESNVATLEEYYARVRKEEHDLDRLIDAVSIGETYFFREPDQFDFLREHIVSELQRTRGFDTPLQIWSAGCASGEEAYSIAILLEEMGVEPNSRVLGTDISKSAIARARSASYRAWSLRTASRDFSDRYFTLDNLNYQLCDRIRERAVFEQHNLNFEALPAMAMNSGCDVIFLRNVLIYFGRDSAHALVTRLTSCLREGGWLITASCDPPVQGIAELESISSNGCVFYRRRAAGSHAFLPHGDQTPALPGAGQSASTEKPDDINATDAPVAGICAFDAHAAQDALRVGNYVEALRLTDAYPDNAEAKALSVRATANLTGSLAAYRECERSCRDHPLSIELHYLRGVFLFDLGRANDAADAFRRVVYLDPSSALAHFSLGTILAKSGDIARARRAFQNAYSICAQMDPADVVPLTDDEPAEQMAAAVKARLDTLGTDHTEGERSNP
jgi:chemotaxis protein methyltransferase CheR